MNAMDMPRDTCISMWQWKNHAPVHDKQKPCLERIAHEG